MRILIRVILVFALSAASLALLAGQVSPPVTSPATAGVSQGRGGGPASTAAPVILKSGTGIIVGRAVEPETTTGVAGAMVILSGAALNSPAAVFDDGTRGGPRRATTDSQGQFLFHGLPAGSYSLTASAPGHVTGRYGESRLIQIQRSLDLALARTVDVSDTDRFSRAEIRMWKLGGISGRVVDEAGEPMVRVPVTVLARVTDWSGPAMRPMDQVVTDDRGIYHSDVTPGTYIVGVLAATTTMPVAAVEGFLQAQREGGTALQRYLTGISGTGGILPRGYGTRVDQFTVSQFGNLNAPVVPPVSADGAGWQFYPSVFHPSSYSAPSAGIVTVAPGEEKSGVDLVLRPQPARRVSGQVIGPDGPVPGLTLSLVPPDPAVSRTSPATLIDTPRALADANGDFMFLGVAPGTYILRVARRPVAPSEPVLWSAETVAVGDTDVRDLRVRLNTGGVIAGRIVIESKGPPPPPTLLNSLWITPRAVTGSTAAMLVTVAGNSRMAPRPDANGRFVTPQVAPGPYVLVVNGPLPGRFTIKSATLAGQDVLDKPFDVTPSGVADIVVTISDQISTLIGTARDGAGEPVKLASVAVFPVDVSLWRLPGMASRRVRAAPLGPDGRYAFSGLPAGDYYVVAVDWPGADFSDPTVLRALIGSASRVTIGEGTSHSQDLRVMVRR